MQANFKSNYLVLHHPHPTPQIYKINANISETEGVFQFFIAKCYMLKTGHLDTLRLNSISHLKKLRNKNVSLPKTGQWKILD